MYYLYKTAIENGITHYFYEDTATVFGSINGVIVKILQKITPEGQNEEYKWKIDLDKDLNKIELINKTIVIDLKPNTENNISLYKITNIYGYSSCGWTPMMFRLMALKVDEEGVEEDKNEFYINEDEVDIIYTFHHVYDGTVKNGKIVGKWIPPRPSSTNSALLWEDTIEYFIECIQNQKKCLTPASTL